MTPPTAALDGGRLITLPGAGVHVYEEGPVGGHPIVLLHGFGTSAFTWRHVYPALARENRVFLVDLPGSGRSPDPPAGAWSADRGADLLWQLFDTLELESPTVAGSQMGGSLAAWFAARYPDRVGRLVLLAAGVLGEAEANMTLYRLLASPRIGPWVARHLPRRAFTRRWQAAHGTGYQDTAATAGYFEQFRSRGHAMARVGMGIRLSYGESFDALAGPLSGLHIPTLLIFGEADALVPVATGHRFQSLMPHARLILLPSCGDFPQEEDPARVVTEILNFLAEGAGADGSSARSA